MNAEEKSRSFDFAQDDGCIKLRLKSVRLPFIIFALGPSSMLEPT
jgi:hypothetical protein